MSDDKIIRRDRATDGRDANPRETRESETREATQRSVEWSDYRPPSQLPDPRPEPGFVYRWVRKSSFGQVDERNMWERRSEGWTPVHPDEQPEVVAQLAIKPDAGLIEMGGLLLCKAPKDRIDARTAYYARMARAQEQAVDNDMLKQQDARMPFLKPERMTRVSRNRNF